MFQNIYINKAKKLSANNTFILTALRTLLCHAALIEELLDEGYRYILTSSFQSDSLKRRFEQYRQMSGGGFLVRLRHGIHSEKNHENKQLTKGRRESSH